MKPFAIATAGVAALFAIGTAQVAPATATTLSFDYDATVSVTGELDSFFSDLLESSGIDLDSALNFSDSFSGSFTTLDDPDQYLDGDISLDYDFFSNFTDFDLSGFGITDLDELFDLDFSGTGSLWSDVANDYTDFDFSYDSDLNSILITGFNTDLVAGCTTGGCETTAWGDFTLSTSLLGPDMSVAYGEVDIEITTTPQAEASTSEPQSIPEPAPVLGLLGVGALMLKTKSSQGRCA